MKLKCLNPKCTYKKLPSYDMCCPKCCADNYYLYHYQTTEESTATDDLTTSVNRKED